MKFIRKFKNFLQRGVRIPLVGIRIGLHLTREPGGAGPKAMPYGKKLLFGKDFLNSGLKVNYLDIGARGDVFEPWSFFPSESLKVIGFEPDAAECRRLQTEFPERIYFPHAAWGSNKKAPFYLNTNQPTSSMYPPNLEHIKQYQPKHWADRVPERRIKMPCRTLDSTLSKEQWPSFLKIDTQGAEYEVLTGAKKILENSAPLVLTETWCDEVYKSAPMSHEIAKFMWERGYQIFDLNIAAAWHHSNERGKNFRCKQKIVGLDFLFVRRFEYLARLPEEKLIVLIGLLELYGFADYAFYIAQNHRKITAAMREKICSELIANNESPAAQVYPLLHW